MPRVATIPTETFCQICCLNGHFGWSLWIGFCQNFPRSIDLCVTDSPVDLRIIFAVDMESILILHDHRIPNCIKRFGIPVSWIGLGVNCLSNRSSLDSPNRHIRTMVSVLWNKRIRKMNFSRRKVSNWFTGIEFANIICAAGWSVTNGQRYVIVWRFRFRFNWWCWCTQC